MKNQPNQPNCLWLTKFENMAQAIQTRKLMEDAVSELTDNMISKTVQNVSFEHIYASIYRAMVARLGRVWVSLMYTSAKRLVFEFRKNYSYYFKCSLMMRDVSMFAEVTFCRMNPYCRAAEIFKRVWNSWHSNKELRARVLWGRVRAMRTKISVLSIISSIYTEISLRPENTGYIRCKDEFYRSAKKQKRN